ncbi:MAG: hypothetical protein HY779_04440, partial [Rubrobacteridae bacterium]|nr:hypothetical protein [Rubrobacteridae bacterium]
QTNIEKRFVEREIDIIKPKLIVTLGAKSSQWFLGKDFKLTKDRGNLYKWNGITILPTFHPAAVLRALGFDDETRKNDFRNDLKKIRGLLAESQAA